MPARRLEYEHAKEEGVNFLFLIQPQEFIPDNSGCVKAIKCLKCKLGEKDSTGRNRPIPIEGSSFELECDLAIVAIGTKSNRILIQNVPNLKLNEEKEIEVDNDMRTSIEGIFAGGDIVGGEGTVIEAMGMAKKASRAIIRYILNKI